MADESVVLNLDNCICLKKDRKSNPPQKPTRISNPPYSILLIHPGNNKTTTICLAISNPFKNTNLKKTKTFVWVMGRTSCTASTCVLVCVVCACNFTLPKLSAQTPRACSGLWSNQILGAQGRSPHNTCRPDKYLQDVHFFIFGPRVRNPREDIGSMQ